MNVVVTLLSADAEADVQRAQAAELGVRLLTFDEGIYQAAFPNLMVVALPTR